MAEHEWKQVQLQHDREVSDCNDNDADMCRRVLAKFPHAKDRLDYFLMRVQFHAWSEHPNVTAARNGTPILSFVEVNASLEINSARMTEWRKSTIKLIDPNAKWMTLTGIPVSVAVDNGTLRCCYKKGIRMEYYCCGLDGLATTSGVHCISDLSLIPVI